MNLLFSPHGWETVHRMYEAGCALDLSYLRRRYAPVQVFSHLGEVEFFGVDANQFSFQLHLQMVAQKPVTITRIEMEAELPGKVEWAQRCRDHGTYCLHPGFQEFPDNMLQSWLLYYRHRLKAGVCIEGLLAGRCRAPMPHVDKGKPLEARLLVTNGRGYRFEFPLQV